MMRARWLFLGGVILLLTLLLVLAYVLQQEFDSREVATATSFVPTLAAGMVARDELPRSRTLVAVPRGRMS